MSFDLGKLDNDNSLDTTTPKDTNKQSSDSLYLQKLQFKKEDWNSSVAFFIKKFRVVIMLIAAMFIWGGISLFSMPLESDPEVEIPIGVVVVGLPGASPSDVEELIVNKIEPKLSNLSGLNKLTSVSSNSFANISVEFNANEDIDDAIRRLRDAVDSAKSELPDEAMDPVVKQIAIEDIPVWTIIVSGPFDNFTLREYADIVKDELESLPGTSEVRINGGDTKEIRVSYDPNKLQTYGLSADRVNNIIASTNLSLPLGDMDISNFNYTIRTDGKFKSAADVRNLPVGNFNGQIVYLKDVADVMERAENRKVITKFSVNKEKPFNAISLSVVKKVGSSIVDLIDDGKTKIDSLKKDKLPEGLNIESTLDFSKKIRDNIENLTKNGLSTIVLVVFILFLFVGFKEAFVAGLAIPMVFAMSFGIMSAEGITLNYLSLFSLILALGMLVDNAIVVLQASKQYIRTGKFTPEEASLLVFKDFKYTLITTTLTTVWAFLPLLLSTGILGQFIKSIPITVSATLISSLLIAFYVNHPLVAVMERARFTRKWFYLIYGAVLALFAFALFSLKSPDNMAIKIAGTVSLGVLLVILAIYYYSKLKFKLIENEEMQLAEYADDELIKKRLYEKYKDDDKKKGIGRRFYTGIVKLDKILPLYSKILKFLLNRKIISVIVLFLIFSIFSVSMALPMTGLLKTEFLPPNDYEYMYINIEGAPGLVTEKIQNVVDDVTNIVIKEEPIKNFSVIVGAAGSNVSKLQSTQAGNQSNKAQIAILLYDFEDRPINEALGRPEKSYEFAARLRGLLKPIKGAKITVQEIAGGPPSGADFELRIAGDNIETLEQLSTKYLSVLREIPGVVDAKSSIELSPGEFTLKFDYNQMQAHSVNVAQVSSILRMALSSTEITKVYKQGDDLNVVADFKDTSISDINSILDLTFLNGRGQTYRLRDIFDTKLESSLTSINHIDEKRVVTIASSVESPHLPGEVMSEFLNRVKNDPPPDGYEFVFGGANETTIDSIMSILNAMLVALILIIGTLIIQLNSFRKAFIVLVTIPLATTGVFYGLLLIGSNVTFPVLIGVLALFGIVINNAIIMVDKIGANLKAGIPFRDAVIDGSQSRLESIFLTSIATIIGMIPLTLNDEIWGGLGASLIFGLSSSMFLTVIVIPILYNLLLGSQSLREEKIISMKTR